MARLYEFFRSFKDLFLDFCPLRRIHPKGWKRIQRNEYQIKRIMRSLHNRHIGRFLNVSLTRAPSAFFPGGASEISHPPAPGKFAEKTL